MFVLCPPPPREPASIRGPDPRSRPREPEYPPRFGVKNCRGFLPVTGAEDCSLCAYQGASDLGRHTQVLPSSLDLVSGPVDCLPSPGEVQVGQVLGDQGPWRTQKGPKRSYGLSASPERTLSPVKVPPDALCSGVRGGVPPRKREPKTEGLQRRIQSPPSRVPIS